MPTTSRIHTPVSPDFVPTLAFEDTNLDGLPEPSPSQPWPLTAYADDQNDSFSFTSQSWPPASEFSTRPSFGAAGMELGFDDALDEDTPGSDADYACSPAAAFLSAFTPSVPASDPFHQVIAGYTLGATIGYGGFSTIKEATSPSGGTVAVKIVRHSAFNGLTPAEKARQRSRLSHEARVWVSLSHENILPLFDSHRTSEATYLITLYCPAGSLLDILKREGTPALEQTDAGCMFRQVVKALQYLHESMGLVHGDIKLENVLVDESGVCRLGDFGLTRQIGGDSSQVSSDDEAEDIAASNGKRDRNRGRRAGTSALPVHLSLIRHGPQRHRNSTPLPATTPPPTHPDHMFQPGSLPYAAPELLLPHISSEAVHGHGSRPTAHPAQDMWALGVMLYALLTGMLPFRDGFEPRLQMKILRGLYEIPPAIGPLAESVLKGCLERDINERWTIAMVDDASWGIGYGNVGLDPVICAEQRSESQSRTPPHLQPPVSDDLTMSLSSCSLASSPPVLSPGPRGRLPHMDARSQSRSASPSVAPRTPDDDYTMYFGRGRRWQRDEDDVQIIVEGEEDEWDARNRMYDEDSVSSNLDAEPLEDKKQERAESVRGRQGAVGPGVGETRKKSQSRTRNWTFGRLAR